MPAPETWAAILRDPSLTDDIFGVQVSFAYALDREISGGLASWPKAMALEERILLTVILNLSWKPSANQ
jgi:hypothetical protein